MRRVAQANSLLFTDERPLTSHVPFGFPSLGALVVILEAWVNTRDERPEQLTVELPAELRSDELARKLQSAIRKDLRETSEESAKLRIYSHSELRQAQIAFVFLVACLFASNVVDQATSDDGLADSIAQGLVVVGWVALWGPPTTSSRGSRAGSTTNATRSSPRSR